MASASDFKVKKGLQVQGGDVNLGGGTIAGVIQVDARTSGVGLDLTISAGESSAGGSAGGSLNLATSAENSGGTNKIVIGPTGITTLTAGGDLDIGAHELRAETFESDVTTGTAPLTVASTTEVANLNAAKLSNADWDAPLAIGGTTAAAGTFTALAATSGDFGNGNIANVGDIDADSISIADAASGLNIDMSGANTTTAKITLRDNMADALNITEASNSYMKFTTTDGSDEADSGLITFSKDTTFASTNIHNLGTVSAATSITSSALVGPIDGILGGSTPAAASVTTLSASSTGAIAGAVSLGSASAASTVTQVSSSAGVHGKSMTITAGSPTGGSGTADRTGGNLLLHGGQGTGTATGGSIIFKSAGAHPSASSATLNALDDTLLTLASTGAATFGGAVSGITTLGIGGALSGVTTLAASGAVTVGSDGSGADVTFYSATAGDKFVWDSSEEMLIVTGTNGQDAIQVPDGNVAITDNLTVDGNGTFDVVKTDTVDESTTGAGVTVDNVLLKDSAVYPGGSITNKGKLYDDASNVYLTHTHASAANINLVAIGTGNVLIDNLIMGGDTIQNNTASLNLEGVSTGGVLISKSDQFVAIGGTGIDERNNTAGNFDIGLQVNPGASAGQYAEVRIKTSTESPIANSAPGSCLVLRNANTSATGTNATYYDFGTDSDGAVWGTGTLHGDPNIFTIGNFIGKSYDGVKNTNDQTPTVAANSVLEIRKPTAAKAIKDVLTIVNTVNAVDMDGTGSAIAFDQWYFDGSTPARTDAGRVTVKTETDWTTTGSTRDAAMTFGVALNNTVTDSLTLNSDGSVGFRSYTFPTAIGGSGEVLKAPSSGTLLEWASDTGGGTASDVAADDIDNGNSAITLTTTADDGTITIGSQVSSNTTAGRDITIYGGKSKNAAGGSVVIQGGGTTAGSGNLSTPITGLTVAGTGVTTFSDKGVFFGADDVAPQVMFYGNTASKYMAWNDGNDNFTIVGSTIDVNGTTIDIDATTTCAIDNSNTTNGVTLNTATSGSPVSIGHTTSETTVNDNLTVTGDLTVSGTTTTVSSTVVSVADPIFELGSSASDDNLDRGIKMKWHDGSAAKIAFMGYDDSTGKFLMIADATDSTNTFSGTASTLVANLDGTVNTASQASITTTANLTTVGALNAGSITSGFGTIDVGTSAISTTGTVTAGPIVSTGLSMDSTVLMDYYKSGSLTATTAVTMFDIVSATYSAFKVIVSVYKNASPYDRSVAEYLITTRGDDGPTTDSDDLFMTEYAIVETGGAALATVTAVKDSTSTKIKVAPASTTSTYVRAQITQFVI